MSDYERLEREERKPKAIRDHTQAWNRLRAIEDVNGDAQVALERFCQRKQITVDALQALGARVIHNPAAHRDPVGWCLAFAGTKGNGKVTAIKYRPLNGSSHDSFTEKPSVWLRPIVAGKLDSPNWLIAEGETDAARLLELTDGKSAVVALPTGARAAFKPEWAALIPRGATVALCHDADKDGDEGAKKAARVLGGRTVRLRPPVDGGDWCDWNGDRDTFLALAASVRAAPRFEFSTYNEFCAHEFPVAEPLLGEPEKLYLGVGSLFMVYGADGSAKSTWTNDGMVHLAAGADWLGIPVPRPVRICLIENEGPPSLFQQKLRNRVATWDGDDPTPNLFVFTGPWGAFSFVDPDARAALRDYCDEHRIDLVAANPTLGLGVGSSGKPDETQQFVDWLVECGLKASRAFWLLHHENKSGQISGDWGRHPDTKVSLARDGNNQRTKLDWNKTRWATLEPSEKVVMLEWVLDTQSYTVTELNAAGASDAELDERIQAYLSDHPTSSTTAVCANVKGANGRIIARLNAKFDHVRGPRGAKLWLPGAKGDADPFEGWRSESYKPSECDYPAAKRAPLLGATITWRPRQLDVLGLFGDDHHDLVVQTDPDH